jgi:hypothetical protein
MQCLIVNTCHVKRETLNLERESVAKAAIWKHLDVEEA